MPAAKGFPCPECRGVRLLVTTTRLVAPDLLVRYLKCATCSKTQKMESMLVPIRRRRPKSKED